MLTHAIAGSSTDVYRECLLVLAFTIPFDNFASGMIRKKAVHREKVLLHRMVNRQNHQKALTVD